jgi:hypothetical protein
LPTLHEKLGISSRVDRGLTYGLPDSPSRNTRLGSEDADSTNNDLGHNTHWEDD